MRLCEQSTDGISAAADKHILAAGLLLEMIYSAYALTRMRHAPVAIAMLIAPPPPVLN